MGETTIERSARALNLHSPHNLCYANAVLHKLHYARSFTGQISGLGALCGALAQAARSSGETNIARDSAWSFIWNGWQRPTHQHDAAEFLQHLCQKTDCTALRGGWEARRHRGGAYEILDEQFTCPHIRLILERPFHLQDAVDKWHQQECVHAFTRPPDTLILQVGRFLQTERGIRKTRQSFQLQKKVRIPIFTDHSGTIQHIDYEICGGVLHVGKVVTAGHYQAFYFPSQHEDIWQSHLVHYDDGHATPGTAATKQAICTKTNFRNVTAGVCGLHPLRYQRANSYHELIICGHQFLKAVSEDYLTLLLDATRLRAILSLATLVQLTC